ncbi:polysaccharide biosynthesis C-terminal domain-containing protein [Turicibacter sanguinis]|uniref:polysaccharide biosynthesis C-terminal domain-containing protein n=1 Tax=Turicibacter sanguinis TaxID=154288 RepID=UPI002943C625|nr:polysaccharide biosynthesis C-terminal domain-containing protein [Turicibacter sanguinis]
MAGTILTTIILNRYLGPSLRGEYALVMNSLMLITSILNLGLPQVYHYFYRKSENYFVIFKNLIFIQFVFLVSIGTIIQLFFSLEFSVKILLILIPIVILTQQINIISLVTNINLRNRNNIIVSFTNVLIWIIISLTIKRNLIVAFFIYAFKEILFCLISKDVIKFKFSEFKFEFKEWKKIIVVAFIPMITMILNTMNYRVDTLILGYSVSSYQLGLYSAALSIAEIAWIFPDIFKEIMFNKSAKNDSISLICKSIRITLFINLIMIITIIIFGKLIIYILMGKEYLASYSVIILLFFGIPSMSFFKIINPLYLANGKQMFGFKALFISVIVNIFLNILLIPYIGINGAAISSIVSYSICGFIFVHSFSKEYNIKICEIIFLKIEDLKEIINIVKKCYKKS